MDRPTPTRIRKSRTMHKCTYPQCGKAFTKKSNMLIHSRIHTGETPYKCRYIGCGRSYKWLSSINFHQSRCDKKDRGLVSPPHKPPTPPAEAARRAAAAAAASANIPDNSNPLVNLGNPSTPAPPFHHVAPLQQLPSLPSVQSLQLAPSQNPMNPLPQTQVPTMHPPLSLPSHPQYSQHNYNLAMQQSSYTQVPPIQSTISMQSPFHHPNIQYLDTHGAGPSSITGQHPNISQQSYTQIQQRQDQEQPQDQQQQQQQQQNQQYPPRPHPQQPSFLSIPITQTMDEHSSTARYLQPLPQIQSQQQQPSSHITVEQSGTTVASPPPPPPPSSNTNTYGSTDQSQLFHPQRKGRFRTELNYMNDNQSNELNLKSGMTSTTYRAGEDIGTTLAIAAATSQLPMSNADAVYFTKMIFNGKLNAKSMIEADTTTTVTTASAMDTTLDISEDAKALFIACARKDNNINSNNKDSTYRACDKSHDSWSSTTGKNKGSKNFLPKSPESATSKEVRELLAPNAPGIILTGTSEVQTSRCRNGNNRNTELETIGESFRFGDEFFVPSYEIIGNEMLDDLTANSYPLDLDQCSPESESIGVFE